MYNYDKKPEGESKPRPLSADDVNDGYDHAFATRPDGEPGEATQVFDQAGSALAEGLAQRHEPIGEGEITEAADAEAANDAQYAADENPFEGTTIDPKSVEARTLAAVEGMKQDMQKAVEEAGKALAEGDTDKASEIAKGLFTNLEAVGVKDLPPEVQAMYTDVKDNLTAAIKEKDPTAKAKLYKFACGAADFIPVAGPAKMLVEAVAGKTLGGDQLSGWKRFLHGTEGLVFLAVDLTGFGVVATKLAKGGKSGLMAAKLMTRSAALLRVLKAPRSVYRPVFTAGRFLMRHPRLGQLATRGLNTIIKGRKLRLAKELPSIVRSEVADVTKRDGMELESTPPDYELKQEAVEESPLAA